MKKYENLPKNHQKKIVDTIIDLFDFPFWSRRKKIKAVKEAKNRAWEYHTIEGMNFLFGYKTGERDVVSVILEGV